MPVTRGEPASTAVAYDSLTKPEIIANLRQNLPRDIRATPAFVMFKFAPAREPGGKRMKLPYYVVNRKVRSGAQGSEEDISHLVKFRTALDLLEADTAAKWAGIGICALRTNPFFAIDIDHCLDASGRPNTLAKELLGWNTYTEYSPSGKGLRLLMLGNPQVNYKNNSIGLELFCNKGFVTLTGNRYGKVKDNLVQVSEAQVARLKTLVHSDGNGSESSNGSVADDIVNIPSPLNDERFLDVRKALKHLDPDCGYDDWLLVGQALHSGDSRSDGRGFKLWLRWSRKGDKFERTSEEEMLRKWQSFSAGRGVTLATLFHKVKESGYRPPKDVFPTVEGELEYYTAATIPTTEEHPLAVGLFDHYGAYLFIGRAKIGKSRILGPLCGAALAGGVALGFKFTKKCRVLAMTLEEDASALMGRMRCYSVEPNDYGADTFRVIDDRIAVRAAKQHSDDIDWIEYLNLLLTQFKPDFVYIDTMIKIRMIWQNDPEYKSKNVTEQDYLNASHLDQAAQRHKCVILGVIHGSKRKNMPALNANFDPFESVGTTSWILAGCTGALVLMDKPGANALEEKDDGQRVFSIRGRYQKTGDTHWVLQSNPTGTFTNLGEYHHVIATLKQHEYLQILSDLLAEGADWVTARSISAIAGCKERTVKVILHKFAETQQLWDERKLESMTGRGYRLCQVARKMPDKFTVVGKYDDILGPE